MSYFSFHTQTREFEEILKMFARYAVSLEPSLARGHARTPGRACDETHRTHAKIPADMVLPRLATTICVSVILSSHMR